MKDTVCCRGWSFDTRRAIGRRLYVVAEVSIGAGTPERSDANIEPCCSSSPTQPQSLHPENKTLVAGT